MNEEKRRLDLRRRQLAARQAQSRAQMPDAPGNTPSEQPTAVDTSFMGRAKDNVFGVDDGVQSVGEKIAAFLNKGGESMTMGVVGDEAAAGLDSMIGRGGYEQRRDQYRQQEAQLEEENPMLSLGADVGGAMAGLALPGGIAMKGMGLGKRILASGAIGAAQGGLYGFMEGEGGLQARAKDAKQDAAVSGALGMAIPIAGAGIAKALDGRMARKAITNAAKGAPSTEQLRAAGSQAYKAVDDLGVQIKPDAFRRATGDVMDTMQRGGLDQLPGPSSLTPKSARLGQIMGEMGSEMASEPSAALPFSSLDQLRRKAGVAASDMGNKLESSLGTQAIGKIDDFVNTLSPDDLVSGDAKALGPAIEKARGIWSSMSKSQTIDDAIEASQDYLSGSSSGIRNQFRRILRSDKLNRGFTDAEKTAMRRVVNGTIPEQMLNLAGGGLGQLGAVGAGIGLGGAPGFIAGAGLGMAARKGSEAVTGKNAEIVRAMIANGGLKSLPKSDPKIKQISEMLMRRVSAASQN
ncbi:putative internal virion protein/injection protein [Sulfitobacter phage phiGT1]|nr:putative internal virion protein/injection protein [Sulfitobacter phage phiGT1]